MAAVTVEEVIFRADAFLTQAGVGPERQRAVERDGLTHGPVLHRVALAVAPGDVVPCRELGLDDLRIFRLWGQYKIGHADSATQPAGPDALGGFEVLARIGASIAPPPAAPAKPAKRTRAGA